MRVGSELPEDDNVIPSRLAAEENQEVSAP
jgi:hypothetical protein